MLPPGGSVEVAVKTVCRNRIAGPLPCYNGWPAIGKANGKSHFTLPETIIGLDDESCAARIVEAAATALALPIGLIPPAGRSIGSDHNLDTRICGRPGRKRLAHKRRAPVAACRRS